MTKRIRPWGAKGMPDVVSGAATMDVKGETERGARYIGENTLTAEEDKHKSED